MLSNEPEGKAYEELVDFASSVCKEFLFVKRNNIYHCEAEKLLSELSIDLVQVKEQESWPGTNLAGSSATVYYFKFNYKTREAIKKYVTGLFSWLPPLEDLCFLKENKQPWLITVAHERIAWFTNETPEEITILQSINGIDLKWV
jgi:hypothetical protein